ncbi:MAG: LytTR family DNA-binding domain-containing protein [Pseudomonadota bacterium]
MTRLRTLLVDDEPLAIERMQVLLSDIEDVEIAGTALDGESALRLVDSLSLDLVFLDISMPGMTGMEIAETLAQKDAPPAVIFVTAFDRYAARAFDVAAVDYLLKPVPRARLRTAIDRARTDRDARPQNDYLTEFWVPHRTGMRRIACEDVDHISAERDYMRLHVGEASFLLHETAKALERRLDPDAFIRTHRSHIFRRAAIRRIVHDGLGIWSVELADGQSFRIGKTYLAGVKDMMKSAA